ncbi:hypothetical protein Bbelb_339570 [Branchiostoma belcheri]|nr:hypothetical protein Bbelb_339570 [Branchiostoma belcheri]
MFRLHQSAAFLVMTTLMTLSLLGGLFAYSRLSGVGRRLSPLATRDATIPDRDATIPDRNTTLLNRDATIPDRNTTLPDRDTTLLDRDATIPDRNATLPDRDARIPDRDTTLLDRDGTIPDKDTTLLDRDGTIPDRDATHPDRDAMIPDRDTTKDATRNNMQRAPVTTPPVPHFDPFVRELLDDPVFHNSSALAKNNATHRPPGELLRILGKIDSRPWSFNKLAVQQIRRELEESTHTRELLVLTQQNTQPNTSIGFAHRNNKFYIPESLHKYQPQEMPFANASYKECSIVGNSGILVNSGCGQRIDQAEFVIRFNFPPVLTKFMKDSGIRTHLFTCNADIVNTKFGHLKKSRWVSTFKNYVSVYKYYRSSVLTFPFMTPGKSKKILLDLQKILSDRNVPNKVFLNNPEHRRNMFDFWARRGLEERSLTSGFYMISAALSFCERVRVFGFWPFDRDRRASPLQYHHYGGNLRDKGADNPWHRMDREFYQLVQLHARGIIELVTKPCS